MPGEQIVQDDATVVRINGERLVGFAGCNYLALAHEPRVLAAVSEAATRFGVSTSASRETSGNTPIHEALESGVAAFISRGRASGLLLPDGYTANLAAMQGLSGSHNVAVIDERAHRSLFDAAHLAGLPVVTFAHADADALAGVLGDLSGPAAVLTDGVFTADGALAPLRRLHGALRPGDTLLVDDCHGFCVLGDDGRGTCDALGLEYRQLIVTTTLAKGLGCGGGVIVAPHEVVEHIRTRSTAYICTTPVSPLVASAGLAALRIVREEPGRVARLRHNAARLAEVCPVEKNPAPTPIAAFLPPAGTTGEAMNRMLREHGVYVPWMSYPGGPGGAYFRASVTAAHTDGQIALLAEALRDCGVAACPV